MAALAAAVALVQWALVVGTLHVALRRAMRGRGLPRWGVGDTFLVSPLFALGTLAGTTGLAWALARGAAAALGGGALLPAITPGLGVALAGLVVAAFGIRAVGKLY